MSRREPDPTKAPSPDELAQRAERRRARWALVAEILLAFGPVAMVGAGVAFWLGWPFGLIVAGGMVWWDDRAAQPHGGGAAGDPTQQTRRP